MSDTYVPFATGPTLISFGESGEEVPLGYAEDRVMMRIQPFWDLVHSDAYGGLAGPPADRQLMGAVVQISALLTAYDDDAADVLHSFSATENPFGDGYLPIVGAFARQDSLAGSLILSARAEDRTFGVATLTEAQELNSSARHRRFQVGWTAEVDDACAMQLMTITRTGTDPCNATS